MGDFRADIKIHMTLIGEEYKTNMWINYNGFDGVDPRVIEFFEKSWKDAHAKYQERTEREDRKRRKEEIEKQEQETLAQLKKKYES